MAAGTPIHDGETTIEPANGRSLEQVTAQRLADCAFPGARPQAITLGNEPASMLDSFPGQDTSRRVVAIHGDRVVDIVIDHIGRSHDTAGGQAEAAHNMITGSFRFIAWSRERCRQIEKCISRRRGIYVRAKKRSITVKKGVRLLLSPMLILIWLSACQVAQRATPLPTLGPARLASPTLLPPSATPTLEPTSTPEPPTSTSTPEPTSTSVPPTSTPIPPTPTSTRTPTVERILFASRATQSTVEGHLPANGSKIYVMGVAAGQYLEMNATVGETGQGLRFAIVGADGTVVRAMGEAHVRAVVPRTQDYYVELVSDVGAVSYRMSVLIPVRIRFAPGTTSAEVAGSLAANGVRHYVLRALAGQRMIVAWHASRGQVSLVISGADGQVLLSGNVAGDGYDGILPSTQDYLIAVRALDDAGADYTLQITILPL